MNSARRRISSEFRANYGTKVIEPKREATPGPDHVTVYISPSGKLFMTAYKHFHAKESFCALPKPHWITRGEMRRLNKAGIAADTIVAHLRGMAKDMARTGMVDVAFVKNSPIVNELAPPP